MTSLSEYSMNIPEQEYHDYPAWSYSMISKYAKEGFGAIAKIHEHTEPTPSMEFGSLFDSMITRDPLDVMNEYEISDFVPTEGARRVFDRLLEKTTLPFDQIPASVFEEASFDFYANRSVDYRYKALEPMKEYYEARRKGKKVVSQQDWNDASEMMTALYAYKNTGDLFKHTQNDGIEYLYQLQFLQEVMLPSGRMVNVKIMPDLLIVNHNDRTIQPVDLKTSSNPSFQFAENFLKFRYDLQAAVYTDIIMLLIANKANEYEDYQVLPYVFADISRSDKIPATFNYDPKSDSQINGLCYKDYQYKDWMTLLDEIIDYEQTQAVVPNYISLDHPNDLITLLNAR